MSAAAVKLEIYVPKKLYDELKTVADRLGLSIEQVLTRALVIALEEYKKLLPRHARPGGV